MTDAAQKVVNNISQRSDAELEDIIQKTVGATLTSLGIEHNDPIEMQKDFQYMRSSREISESIKRKSWITLVGLAIVGVVTIAINGIKDYFQS